MTTEIRCHYDVLGVPRDADAVTIKKKHRKMALKYHPDKNMGNESAAEEQFRLVQQAYECLSDPQERKWYDEHRDAILAGWSPSSNDNKDVVDMLFDIVPFMHPGCYSGYHNRLGGFYEVYQGVVEQIVQYELQQSEKLVELPTDFGNGNSEWKLVQGFYQGWESFSSYLNFAWEDKFNVHEDAPNRRVRRLMEEENKKARRTAKRAYNQDIWTLVAFLKRRDPRVKAKQLDVANQKKQQERRQREEAAERKIEQQKAKEAWKVESMRAMEEAEEEDRLAGRERVRLADLEDDYDYGGGRKGRKGKKKKNKGQAQESESDSESEDDVEPYPPAEIENTADGVDQPTDKEGDDQATGDGEDQVDEGEDSMQVNGESHIAADEDPNAAVDEAANDVTLEGGDNDPPVWRCEHCWTGKDFKSKEQLENHMKSKKHKEEVEKHEAKLKKKEQEAAIFRCACCWKDFKSQGQLENHMKSKQHKEEFEKYEAKLKKKEEKMKDKREDSAPLDGEDDVALEGDDDDDDFTESEEEPDSWYCECCRKDFKSEGQMENHTKSKKHKGQFKKYQAQVKKKEEEEMARMIDGMDD